MSCGTLVARFVPGMQRRVCKYVWAANAVSFASEDQTVVVLRNPLKQTAMVKLAVGEQQWTLDLAPDSFHTLVIAN